MNGTQESDQAHKEFMLPSAWKSNASGWVRDWIEGVLIQLLRDGDFCTVRMNHGARYGESFCFENLDHAKMCAWKCFVEAKGTLPKSGGCGEAQTEFS
jgi:hypothetical protein